MLNVCVHTTKLRVLTDFLLFLYFKTITHNDMHISMHDRNIHSLYRRLKARDQEAVLISIILYKGTAIVSSAMYKKISQSGVWD